MVCEDHFVWYRQVVQLVQRFQGSCLPSACGMGILILLGRSLSL
jgi:hypothetical protein